MKKKKKKTTMRYHLKSVRMAIIKKYTKKKNGGEGVEKREPFNNVGRSVNWYGHCGE